MSVELEGDKIRFSYIRPMLFSNVSKGHTVEFAGINQLEILKMKRYAYFIFKEERLSKISVLKKYPEKNDDTLKLLEHIRVQGKIQVVRTEYKRDLDTSKLSKNEWIFISMVVLLFAFTICFILYFRG